MLITFQPPRKLLVRDCMYGHRETHLGFEFPCAMGQCSNKHWMWMAKKHKIPQKRCDKRIDDKGGRKAVLIGKVEFP